MRSFGSNPGALRMFTHAPARLAPSPGLVVVLHGCTQSAASYDLGAGWSTLADRYGFALLLPEQQASNNPNTCFNWFQPEDIARDSGEALSIRQMIEKMIVDHGIDRRRVFVTGLSAGGAMATVMLATYPEVFAAGAIIAGLPYGTATNVQQALESMFNGRAHTTQQWGDFVRHASPHRGPWPRVSVWHGDRDPTVKVANADDIVRQWTNVHNIDGPPTEGLVDGYPRQVWRKGGVDVIESYTITGMAHGTPLAAGSEGQAAGAFMLDVGISSSYHIAKFFGLTVAARAPAHADEPAAIPNEPTAVQGERAAIRKESKPSLLVPDESVEFIPDDRVEILDADAGQADSTHQDGGRPGSLNISAIITKALTAAGLMKPRQ
jgi:poly(hydroxyalkanoate) depolymerase family esterase